MSPPITLPGGPATDDGCLMLVFSSSSKSSSNWFSAGGHWRSTTSNQLNVQSGHITGIQPGIISLGGAAGQGAGGGVRA